MGSLRVRPWLCVIMFAATTTTAYSFTANPSPQKTKNVGVKDFNQHILRPELKPAGVVAKFGEGVQVQRDKLSDALRLLSGQLGVSVDTSGNKLRDIAKFVQASLAFVENNPDLFANLKASDLVLDESALLYNDAEQFFKFRVYKNGMLVQDAVVDFRFKHARLLQVYNLGFAEARMPSKQTLVNTKQALAAFKAVRYHGRAYRVISEKSSYQTILVDKYTGTLDGEPFNIQVDAHSGKIFEASPSNHYITGEAKGQIYHRWYKEDLRDASFAFLEVTTNPSQTVTTDVAGRFEFSPDFTAFAEGLRGPRVDVSTRTGTLLRREVRANGSNYELNFDRQGTAAAHEDKDVAQAMIFAHTNYMVDHAKRYIDVPWFDERLPANANLGMSCNAHWDGYSINFYSANDRCANTGLISDVVYHEWGHGLDARTGGIEDGAYSEGFGDIMSLLMTRSNVLGIGFKLDGGAVRDLEPDVTYPEGRGEVHAEGLIIGGTFYDLYKLLRDKHGDDRAIDLLSGYAFKAIMAASRYTEVYDALQVIDDDDADLNNGTPNFCLINEAFAAHGLATRDNRCLLGDMTAFQITEAVGNNNDVIEPGETVLIRPSVLNNTGSDIANVRGVAELKNAIDGVSFQQSELYWPNLVNGAAVPSENSIELSIGSQVACGTTLDLRFLLQSEQRTAAVEKSFLVGRLTGESATFGNDQLPIAIPDFNSIDVPIQVNGEAWQADTKVYRAHLSFEISHTYIGDLTVMLVSPDGRSVEVYKGSGSSDDVSFSADVTSLVNGAVGAGEWYLRVTDRAHQDAGTVDQVSLSLTPAIFECR